MTDNEKNIILREEVARLTAKVTDTVSFIAQRSLKAREEGRQEALREMAKTRNRPSNALAHIAAVETIASILKGWDWAGYSLHDNMMPPTSAAPHDVACDDVAHEILRVYPEIVDRHISPRG